MAQFLDLADSRGNRHSPRLIYLSKRLGRTCARIDVGGDLKHGHQRNESRPQTLWSVADLLRGDYTQSEYGRVILPLTVLRRLDCVLEPVGVDLRSESILFENEGDYAMWTAGTDHTWKAEDEPVVISIRWPSG